MSTLENLNAIEVDDFSSIDVNLIDNYSPKKEIIKKLTIDFWIKKSSEKVNYQAVNLLKLN